MSGSVDPHEVAYYERLAETWWDPQGPFWPLHGLNRFRVGYLRERLLAHYGLADTAHALYVLRWLPRGTHQYHKLRRPAEVAACLRAGGLRPAHRTGVAVSPRTRRFRYTRSLAVNYMMMAVRDGAPAGG